VLSKPASIIYILISIVVSSCSVSVQTEPPVPVAPLIITATLAYTPTPRPLVTSPPPSPTPTIVPVSGTTSTQLNVRAEPSTASEVLGIIAENEAVQIVGQDPDGNWWQIVYEAGVDGRGWVTAQYVETVPKPEVPVIGGNGADPNAANGAVVIQQLNIRSGPGISFDSLGILNTNDVVKLTGRNRDGTWLQIEFTSSADGRGWISAAFIKADALDILPVVSDLGEEVGIGTPMDTPLPPSPTIVPAAMDFDSADAPLKTILFDRVGTHTLIYNGDVSIPDGDTEDWIAFTPYNKYIFMTLQCSGSGSLNVEITGSGSGLTCNEAEKVVTVQADTVQLIHIMAVPSSNTLQYVNYILTIKASR